MAPPSLLRALAWLLLPAAADASFASEPSSHFDCRVTEVEAMPRLGPQGKSAELTRFTCQVRGGLLDGFVATGTNIWGGKQQDGQLLGSMVVARKANSVVVYEVRQVTRQPRPRGAAGRDWEGRGSGVYKLATGTAAPLAGRSFRSVARSAGPRAFTIDTVASD